jgi:outer membrane protein assembly factor BamB
VAGGVVFAGADDGTVRAFDAAGCGAPSCAPLWSDATGSATTGAPAVNQGRLYVGTADGRVVAYGLP